MSHRWLSVLILYLATISLFSSMAFPQGLVGSIAGTVTDQSGAVLKGAQITLESRDINVVSDEQGLFFINDLRPGNYTLTVTYVGFAPFKKTVDVVAGQTANADAKLQLQSETQSIGTGKIGVFYPAV